LDRGIVVSASQGDSGRPKRFGLSSPGRQLAMEPRIPRIIIRAMAIIMEMETVRMVAGAEVFPLRE
jgi:hypothetical protein